MKIGALAKSVGCHVETVRYYENQGLIPASTRSPNGYREYTKTHLQYLRLVRRAKTLGFSQPQIRELVKLASHSVNKCDEVYRITRSQIGVVDQKMTELRRIKKALNSLASACEIKQQNNCPVLENLISDG